MTSIQRTLIFLEYLDLFELILLPNEGGLYVVFGSGFDEANTDGG